MKDTFLLNPFDNFMKYTEYIDGCHRVCGKYKTRILKKFPLCLLEGIDIFFHSFENEIHSCELFSSDMQIIYFLVGLYTKKCYANNNNKELINAIVNKCNLDENITVYIKKDGNCYWKEIKCIDHVNVVLVNIILYINCVYEFIIINKYAKFDDENIVDTKIHDAIVIMNNYINGKLKRSHEFYKELNGIQYLIATILSQVCLTAKRNKKLFDNNSDNGKEIVSCEYTVHNKKNLKEYEKKMK